MATVLEPNIQPDIEAVAHHLALLFGPCVTDYPKGMVEIAHGRPGPDRANLFPLTKEGMKEAVDYAVMQNLRGDNVYVGVNPRRPHTHDAKRASAKDVEIAFWHFADLDHLDVVNLARERLKTSPTRPMIQVTTGRIPTPRVHLYWQLEEPVRNLEEWTRRQEGIADTLSGDPVIDPPRVMRLAGMINYPSEKKEEKGYVPELVTIKSEFEEERSPVTPDQISAEFPRKPKEVAAAEPLPAGETTLSKMARSRSEELISLCQSGVNWHNNMRDLVAHLMGIGTPWPVIYAIAPAITLPGYTVPDTLADMKKALQGAADKWGISPPDEAAVAESAREDREGVFATLSLDELEDLPAPTYLIEGVLPEHGLTFIYGEPGSYKSFAAIDMALRIAYGMDWHGAPAKQVGVLYIAGEGRHGLGKRVKGWRKEHGLEGAPAPFKLLPVAVHMLDKANVEKLKRTIRAVAAEVGFEIGLIIIDTVSRAIPGQDENKQDTMSLFVDGCADIHEFVNGAVIGVHHSGKDRDRGMRGSSVLLGGCEASIRATKEESMVKLEVEKQKDDEEAAPIYMTMKKVEWADGLKTISTLVPLKSEAAATEQKTLTRKQADEIFEEVAKAWESGNPWSAFPHAKRKGRYLIDYIVAQYEVTPRVAEDHLTAWQTREYMKSESPGRNRGTGLRVLRRLEPDQ